MGNINHFNSQVLLSQIFRQNWSEIIVIRFILAVGLIVEVMAGRVILLCYVD